MSLIKLSRPLLVYTTSSTGTSIIVQAFMIAHYWRLWASQWSFRRFLIWHSAQGTELCSVYFRLSFWQMWSLYSTSTHCSLSSYQVGVQIYSLMTQYTVIIQPDQNRDAFHLGNMYVPVFQPTLTQRFIFRLWLVFDTVVNLSIAICSVVHLIRQEAVLKSTRR